MKIDFFSKDCLDITNQQEFGICDGANDNKAFLDHDNAADWLCIILNDRSHIIEFRAIDYCVPILREDGNMEKSCDCMLTYAENIVFIELKNKGKNWKEEGIKQLETTLSNFTASHNLDAFRYKRAFVANRRHPNFQTIEDSTMRRFFSKYKVRLNVQAKVIVK